MRIPHALGVVLIACAIVVITNAGPLDPPAGPIESSYRTLDEVEARTPIAPGNTSTTIVIDEPGSYYLTGDVRKVERGVLITAPGVTLDLNGFTVRNVGVTISNNDRGIEVNIDPADGVGDTVIRNGRVEGFFRFGLSAFGSIGHTVVEDVVVRNCGDGIAITGNGAVRGCAVSAGDDYTPNNGIRVSGDALVESCHVEGVMSDAISVSDGVVRDCVMEGNGVTDVGVRIAGTLQSSVVVESCRARGMTNVGFSSINGTHVFRDCVASDCDGGGFVVSSDACVFEHCTAQNSTGGAGFSVESGSSLSHCTASGNALAGFAAFANTSFAHCSANGNTGNGFTTGGRAKLQACSANDNTRSGFNLGAASAATDCTASINDENGFTMSSDCRVTGSLADGNGSAGANFAGIFANSDCTIDGNTVTDNPIGITSSPTSPSIIVRNYAAGNVTNYILGAADAGPISTNPMTATNPWTNFSY